MYEWFLILAFIVLIGGITAFIIINRPPGPPTPNPPTPTPTPTPGPKCARGNDWPMEPELFFIDITKTNRYVLSPKDVNGSINAGSYVFNDFDTMRMWPLYTIPNSTYVDDYFNNSGGDYLYGTDLYIYNGGAQDIQIPLPAEGTPLGGYLNTYNISYGTSNKINVNKKSQEFSSNQKRVLYPVYGYKPIQLIAGKSQILMRSNGFLRYVDADGSPIEFGTNIGYTCTNANCNTDIVNWNTNQLNILPFSKQNWSQWDVNPASVTTGGNELFIIKSSAYYRLSLNSGYQFATLDQLYYSYSKGMNNGVAAMIMNENLSIALYNVSNPNPKSDYNIVYYGDANNTNRMIDLVKSGYTPLMDTLNFIGYTEVVIDSYNVNSNLNPYIYIWGPKPSINNPSAVSSSCTKILPFMLMQGGNTKWSMYDPPCV